MKYGIVVFPGSNCDHDAYIAASVHSGAEAVNLWHKDTSIQDDINCIILPGGFSYGDYLRCGSIARFSPIMKEVINFAGKGGYVMGICNGFQILTEAGLLPGTLLRNDSLSFKCNDVNLRIMNNSVAFTSSISIGDIITIPIAHGEGNYFADDDTIKKLEDSNRIIFKYCDIEGNITQEANPNGSKNNIAGIVNEKGNVLGMMPHPERYCDSILGRNDGINVFKSINNYFIK
ncbi:phosphoribosylformylglycinamidine synthase subunit PurQ [Bacteroidota bacterium]